MYFLSGVSNSEAWTQVNGEWPLILDTSTNVAQFGGNITSPKWKVLKPVYNLTNRFPNGSGATQVTVATSVVITGNFILHFYNSAYKSVLQVLVYFNYMRFQMREVQIYSLEA